MDFILNSKTKKVEIFYENSAEQQAILEFMSRYLTYREDKTSTNTYIHNPEISWDTVSINTTNPYSITSNSTNVSNTTCLDGIYSSMIKCVDTTIDTTSNVNACYNNTKTYTDTNIKNNITSAIETATNTKENKDYVTTKLDDTSNESDYSYLTVYVPRPSKKDRNS